jgi:hypothetical protein
VEPAPDPIAHEAPVGRPEPRQEAKPEVQQERRVAPARGNEAPRGEQKQEQKQERQDQKDEQKQERRDKKD